MRTWLLAIACVAAGCDAMVDPGYAGEPLVRLQGTATSARSDQLSRAGVLAGALWQRTSVDGPSVFTRMPVRIEFPRFWIDVLAEPAAGDELTIADGDPPIAEAYLHIVEPDTGASPAPSDFLATDYDHALVWVSATPPASSLTAAYLGGSLSPGFHVVDRTATASPSAAQQGLIDRCVAAATDQPPGAAKASCTAQHLYQLAPSADDLDTILDFRVEGL
jgi:hypothetical protein